MREIDFRAWDINGNVMVDWLCMRQTAFNNSKNQMFYDIFTNPQFIKMQFTGMKEIWEGVGI